MKHIIWALAAMTTLLSGIALADEFTSTAMFYIKVPLGESTNKAAKKMRLGFRLDYGQTTNVNAPAQLFDSPLKPALFDYRFASNSHLPSMKINGLEVLEFDRVMRVDGEGGGGGEVNWWLVGAGVLAAGIIINESKDDDDDGENGGMTQVDPPSLQLE